MIKLRDLLLEIPAVKNHPYKPYTPPGVQGSKSRGVKGTTKTVKPQTPQQQGTPAKPKPTPTNDPNLPPEVQGKYPRPGGNYYADPGYQKFIGKVRDGKFIPAEADPNPASPTQGQIQQAQAPVSNAPTIGE